MKFNEIIISVDIKDIERTSDIVHMVSSSGMYIEDYSNINDDTYEFTDKTLIDITLLDKKPRKGLIHIYTDPDYDCLEIQEFLAQRFSFCNIDYNISVIYGNQYNWMENFKKNFMPIKIGKKLLIKPAWDEKFKDFNSKGRIPVILEPGMAFGTGMHETTQLCLEAIEEFINKGDKVLDIGCGSGILSVSSLLLGAAFATAVDIDKFAVKTARANAALNNVEKSLIAVDGNWTGSISGKFDLIVANVTADILINNGLKIVNYLAGPSSVFIISGIIDERIDDVKAVILKSFSIVLEKNRGSWFCLVLTKIPNIDLGNVT